MLNATLPGHVTHYAAVLIVTQLDMASLSHSHREQEGVF